MKTNDESINHKKKRYKVGTFTYDEFETLYYKKQFIVDLNNYVYACDYVKVFDIDDKRASGLKQLLCKRNRNDEFELKRVKIKGLIDKGCEKTFVPKSILKGVDASKVVLFTNGISKFLSKFTPNP